MRKNNKGFSIIEFMIVVVITALVVIMFAALIASINKKIEADEKRTAEISEMIKKTKEYMIIVYKNDSSCDTLYSNSKGYIKSMNGFMFYESDDLSIASKNTIIAIPIKDKYDDAHEFSSGIDLDDY